jgi:hypothetical protein
MRERKRYGYDMDMSDLPIVSREAANVALRRWGDWLTKRVPRHAELVRTLTFDGRRRLGGFAYIAHGGGLVKVGCSRNPVFRAIQLAKWVELSGCAWRAELAIPNGFGSETVLHRALRPFRVSVSDPGTREFYLRCHEIERLVGFLKAAGTIAKAEAA